MGLACGISKAEKKRIARHIPDCYGVAGTCQSCGCDKQGRWSLLPHADGTIGGPCARHALVVPLAAHGD